MSSESNTYDSFGANTAKQLRNIASNKIIVIASRDSSLYTLYVNTVADIISNPNYLEDIEKEFWICNECVAHNFLEYKTCKFCKKPMKYPARV